MTHKFTLRIMLAAVMIALSAATAVADDYMDDIAQRAFDLVKAKNYEEASKLSVKAQHLIDQACQDGILKENSAARKKSSLMSLVDSIKPQA